MKIWTNEALDVLRMAENRAGQLNHETVDPLHLLWAFLAEWPRREAVATLLNLDPEQGVDVADRELAGFPRWGAEEVPRHSEDLLNLFLRAADLAAATTTPGPLGLIGSRELLLALAESDGRAGVLVRSLVRAKDTA